jgi:glycosyltransferase involved in cell wall biosynthesis/GT2 family glycosyltransferase
MNVLHVNTFDRKGGAAIAAHRLHTALRTVGVNSHMGVLYKVTDDPSCFFLTTRFNRLLSRFSLKLDSYPLSFYRRSPQSISFSPMLMPSNTHRLVWNQQPTITHLHWLCFGFFPIFSVGRLKGPVVWTTHDSWPFTGGCHFSGECNRFEENCGKCPELNSNREMDLSRLGWLLKRNAYTRNCPVFVSPSSQFANMARKSSLLREARVEFIPNPVDTESFQPIPKDMARHVLNLPQHGRIILFGAPSATSDPRKGYDLLREALHSLPWANHEDITCVIFGASVGPQGSDLPFPVRFLGHLTDETSLALAYAAADVFVCPSREESFSNTTVEALACGTPVVAFPVGGIPDMVVHKVNGFLAQPFDIKSLAHGIAWILEDPQRHVHLQEAGRKKVVHEFSLAQVSRQYMNLYLELLDKSSIERTRYQYVQAFRPTEPNETEKGVQPVIFTVSRLGENKRLMHPFELLVDSFAYVGRLLAITRNSCNELEKFISNQSIVCPSERRGESIARLTVDGRWRDGRPPAGSEHPLTHEMAIFPRPIPSDMASWVGIPKQFLGEIIKKVLHGMGLLDTAKRCHAWIKRRGCCESPFRIASETTRVLTGVYCGYGLPVHEARVGAVYAVCSLSLTRSVRNINPDPETFASWLAGGNMDHMAEDAVFAFTSSPDTERNVAMLRGLLAPGHRVVVLGRSNYPLFEGWKDVKHFEDGAVMYSGPPQAWLKERQWLQEDRVWPLVTIVMPSFNQRPFVRQALDSIFSQNYPNLELIVLDAGSTDGTRDILQEYESKISRLIFESDNGQSDALQKGFNLATGTYCTWLNTDDLLEPDSLFLAVEAFEHFKVDLVTGGCRVVGEDGKELDKHYPFMPFGFPLRLDAEKLLDFFGSWSRGDFFYQPEVFFTRDIWLRAGGFVHLEAYYAMDYDLWVRMALAGGMIVQLPRFLAASRHQRNQKTNLKGSESPYLWQMLNFLRHYEKILGFLASS